MNVAQVLECIFQVANLLVETTLWRLEIERRFGRDSRFSLVCSFRAVWCRCFGLTWSSWVFVWLGIDRLLCVPSGVRARLVGERTREWKRSGGVEDSRKWRPEEKDCRKPSVVDDEELAVLRRDVARFNQDPTYGEGNSGR